MFSIFDCRAYPPSGCARKKKKTRKTDIKKKGNKDRQPDEDRRRQTDTQAVRQTDGQTERKKQKNKKTMIDYGSWKS